MCALGWALNVAGGFRPAVQHAGTPGCRCGMTYKAQAQRAQRAQPHRYSRNDDLRHVVLGDEHQGADGSHKEGQRGCRQQGVSGRAGMPVSEQEAR